MNTKSSTKNSLNSLTLSLNSSLRTATKRMIQSALKTLVVIDKNFQFMGTISDGDIRRAILVSSLDTTIKDFYNKSSISCQEKDISLTYLKKICQKNLITIIPIINSKNKLTNIYHRSTNKFITPIKNNVKKLNLPVLIMAGGKGKRMKPITNVLPKPLLPIEDETVVSKIMQYFKNQGLNNFIFSINYKKSIMKAYLNDLKKNFKIVYIEEEKFLGTAGSIKKLNTKNFNNIIITNCDILFKFNIRDLYNQHINSNSDITIVTVKINQKLPYGVCEFSKIGHIEKIKEKPYQVINIVSGMYLINKKVISLIKKNEKLDMNDFIERSIKKGLKVLPFYIDQKSWKDVGSLDLFTKFVNKN